MPTSDPKVRRDGRCAQCRSPRLTKIAKNSALRGADRDRINKELASDPFCKTDCARRWHGCPLPKALGRPPLEDAA